jgi:hypothetical protein
VRTTLSLDDDVAAGLRRVQARSGETWKQVVNDVIRAGLTTRERNGRPARPRRTRGVRLGTPRLGDIANVHEVLSLAEGDARP